MIKIDELRHLLEVPSLEERPQSLGIVRFDVHCHKNSDSVLQKSKEILEVILRESTERWLTENEWLAVLPSWFIEEFSPEKSDEENEEWLKRWRTLPLDEQDRAVREDKWTLQNWLYWLHPEQREWFWWDGLVINTNLLRIAVEVSAHPFSWQALTWLFKASGARDIQPEY